MLLRAIWRISLAAAMLGMADVHAFLLHPGLPKPSYRPFLGGKHERLSSSVAAIRWQSLRRRAESLNGRQCGIIVANSIGDQKGSDGDTMRWADGSEIGSTSSLVTLLLALVSIPATAAILGPDCPIAQLQVALSILGVGIPSFRMASLFSVVLFLPAFLSNDEAVTNLCVSAGFAGMASFITSMSGSLSSLGALPEASKSKESEKVLKSNLDADENMLESQWLDDVSPLQSWEKTFDVHVPLPNDPKEWTVDHVARALVAEGLPECAEALTKARIDGKVLLSLSREDEDELRKELGIGLGDRRRLLNFVEELKQRKVLGASE